MLKTETVLFLKSLGTFKRVQHHNTFSWCYLLIVLQWFRITSNYRFFFFYQLVLQILLVAGITHASGNFNSETESDCFTFFYASRVKKPHKFWIVFKHVLKAGQSKILLIREDGHYFRTMWVVYINIVVWKSQHINF